MNNVIVDLDDLGDDAVFYVEQVCIPFKGNAIPIPLKATNGDIVKAMFPDYQIKIGSGQVCLYYSVTEEYSGSLIRFDEEWWNASYKK